MQKLLFIAAILCHLSVYLSSQNVGIGVTDPSEKLEVGGIIYTNEGGIMFPDHSIQSTAAYNKDIIDIAERKLMPLIAFDGIPGELDTLSISNAIPLIYSSNPNGATYTLSGGGSISAIGSSEMTVIKNSSASTPFIAENYFLGAAFPTVEIFYIAEDDSGPFIYMVINMQDVFITGHETVTEYAGDGLFVNYEVIKLTFGKLAYINYLSGFCTCWDYVNSSNTNCGCGSP